MLNIKTLIFLGLFSVFIADSGLRFLQEEVDLTTTLYLNGQEMVKGASFQLKDRTICVRGGTPANSELMNNLNVDADGDYCLPLTWVENIFYKIRTGLQQIKFLCNTHGNSGIDNQLQVSLTFTLSRTDKMKIEELATKIKEKRAASKNNYQEQLKSLEENVQDYNALTIRWNHRNSENSELEAKKASLNEQIAKKRIELKKIEEEINKKNIACEKEHMALIEFNKKVFAVNREIENLDIEHTNNYDQILGLNDYVKNKQIAIEECNKRIENAEKLYNEALSALKELCPKSASDIALIEKSYDERKTEDLIKYADLITAVEPNN